MRNDAASARAARDSGAMKGVSLLPGNLRLSTQTSPVQAHPLQSLPPLGRAPDGPTGSRVAWLASTVVEEGLPRAVVADRAGVADPRLDPSGARLAWLRLSADGAVVVVAPADGSAPPRVVATDPPPARVRPASGGVLAWAGPDRLLLATGDGRIVSVATGAGARTAVAVVAEVE